MTLKDIYQLETAKWDTRFSDLLKQDLQVSTPNFQHYAQQDHLLAGVSEFLGDLHGKSVLEYGCGSGTISVLLAKSGASVTTFDLSRVGAAVTCARAIQNHVEQNISVTVNPGEQLPYMDECFDVVFGKAILHHLDVMLGSAELYRVLKQGGKAVFAEPMGMNPILNVVRDYIPYRGKNPRGADRPLNYQEIRRWGEKYSEFRYQEIQFLSMLERGFGFKTTFPTLRRIDNVLLKRFPFLRRYCRYVVMFMVK